jgi:hypothetical protein
MLDVLKGFLGTTIEAPRGGSGGRIPSASPSAFERVSAAV